MKQILTTAALLLTTVFSFNAKAQISEKDKDDIKKVYEAAATAFQKMDATALSNIFTDNGTHINPMGKITQGRSNLLSLYTNLFSYFKTQPRPDKSTTNLTNQEARYIAPGVILTTYTEETTNYSGDKASSEKYSFAILLVKKNGKWLCEQVTMTPVTGFEK